MLRTIGCLTWTPAGDKPGSMYTVASHISTCQQYYGLPVVNMLDKQSLRCTKLCYLWRFVSGLHKLLALTSLLKGITAIYVVFILSIASSALKPCNGRLHHRIDTDKIYMISTNKDKTSYFSFFLPLDVNVYLFIKCRNS